MLFLHTATPQHRNTATKPSLYLLITTSFFTFTLSSNFAQAAPQTYGYSLPMPNRFWKDTPQISQAPSGIGQPIQQSTAANNPDIFCESQGSGYRLPSINEYSSSNHSISPGHPTAPQSPGHWSAYVNNDITGNRKANIATRAVSGAISNEWGDLTKYGWSGVNYWSSEISHYKNSIGDLGFGRLYFDIKNMKPYSTPAVYGVNAITNAVNANQQNQVACVRDLLPTRATPVPGKS